MNSKLPKDGEELWRDTDGYRIIYHSTEKQSGYVTHDRYPNTQYIYLTAEHAAEKILTGKHIEENYIEALTLTSIEKVYERLAKNKYIDSSVLTEENKLDGIPKKKLNKSIICTNCIINGVCLYGLVINQIVNFTNTIFLDECYFAEAEFEHLAIFGGIQFNSNVCFDRVTFRSLGFFGRVSFRANAFFNQCTAQAELYFRDANFYKYANFAKASILKCSFYGSHFYSLFNIREACVGFISFFEAILMGDIKLSTKNTNAIFSKMKSNFSPSHYDMCQKLIPPSYAINVTKPTELNDLFNNCSRKSRCICTIDFGNISLQGNFQCDFEHLQPSKGEAILYAHQDKNWKEAQKQYSWLKEQYRKQGRYEDEDDAHWWAMWCETENTPPKSRWGIIVLIALVIGVIIDITLLIWVGAKDAFDYLPFAIASIISLVLFAFPYCGKKFAFEKVFGYGVEPWRIVSCIACVLVACGFGYMFGNVKGNDPFESYLLNALYFSVITFATVGYGDISATGWAASLAMIEGLLGVILNAALIVTIFRKIVR